MKNYQSLLPIVFIYIFSFTLSGCGGDDEGEIKDSGKTEKPIDSGGETVQSSCRLDSIFSHEDFDNVKIKYDGSHLISYAEYRDNGKIKDGKAYLLKWYADHVEVWAAGVSRKWMDAIIGSNGYVKECHNSFYSDLDAEGSMRYQFEYDDEGHLIKYNRDNLSKHPNPDIIEIRWENDNVVETTLHFYKVNGSDRDGVWTYNYTYTSLANPANLLPYKHWIEGDTGSDFTEDELMPLYYAGLLGKGTKNLVKVTEFNGKVLSDYVYEQIDSYTMTRSYKSGTSTFTDYIFFTK